MRVIARISLLGLAVILAVIIFLKLKPDAPEVDIKTSLEIAHAELAETRPTPRVINWPENLMDTAKGAHCANGINELIESFDIPNINNESITMMRHDGNTLVQVINGTIFYQPGPSEEMIFERHRREAFLEMLHDTLPYLHRKDFELVLSVKDCCVGTGPIFSVTRCKGTGQLPFVQWNKIRDGPLTKWNHRMRRSRERVRRKPWAGRKSTAVFRGSVAKRWSFDENGVEKQTLITTDNWRRVGRTILAHFANETKQLEYLNVELRYASEKINSYPFKEAESEMSMEEQAQRFKYTVIVEGNCGWADRFKSFLAMGTLCLVQETPCKEYYSLLAKPKQHYIPIAGTLADLTDAIQWSRDHDEEARKIAMNGMKFADTYLTESSMRCYMRELLLAYQQRFNGHVLVDPTLEMFV